MATPVLNEDGVSVKNCSIIYAPQGQAGEYAPLATNPYRGCGHRCKYCYVPGVLRITRAEFDADARPRDGYLQQLERDAEKYEALGVTAQVMLSFTTDPYNPINTSLTRPALQTLSSWISTRSDARTTSERSPTTRTGRITRTGSWRCARSSARATTSKKTCRNICPPATRTRCACGSITKREG